MELYVHYKISPKMSVELWKSYIVHVRLEIFLWSVLSRSTGSFFRFVCHVTNLKKTIGWGAPIYLFCIQMIRGLIHKIKLTFLHFEWWNEVDGALHILPSGKRRKGVFCYPKKRNKSFTIRLLALKGLFDAVHSISRGGTKKAKDFCFQTQIRDWIVLCHPSTRQTQE